MSLRAVFHIPGHSLSVVQQVDDHSAEYRLTTRQHASLRQKRHSVTYLENSGPEVSIRGLTLLRRGRAYGAFRPLRQVASPLVHSRTVHGNSVQHQDSASPTALTSAHT